MCPVAGVLAGLQRQSEVAVPNHPLEPTAPSVGFWGRRGSVGGGGGSTWAFGFPQVQAQAKQPLKDAAAVNTTRWTLYEALKTTGQPVETGTGGRTESNRVRLRMAKSHWDAAACVGASTPDTLAVASQQLL